MIEDLREFFPDFGHIEESSIQTQSLQKFWQVTAFTKTGESLGSGFSKDLNSARKIAIAEFIERHFVRDLRSSNEGEKWMIDSHPTACGFAVGFDPLNAQIRSIGEGIERWALSKWIDGECYLEKDNVPTWPTEAISLKNEFEEIFVFKKEFIYNFEGRVITYHLVVVVAFHGAGSFMGSAVRPGFQDSLAHALIEAHRHLLISKQNRNFDIYPFNRIKYFAENGQVARGLLSVDRTRDWPAPILIFQRSFQNNLFSISRTIFNDWTPWERGSLERMLY